MARSGRALRCAACVLGAAGALAAVWLWAARRRREKEGGGRRGEAPAADPAAAAPAPLPAELSEVIPLFPPEPPCAAPAEESAVWWTSGGHTYHQSAQCMTLRRTHAESLRRGTVAEARRGGKTVLCRRCGAQS